MSLYDKFGGRSRTCEYQSRTGAISGAFIAAPPIRKLPGSRRNIILGGIEALGGDLRGWDSQGAHHGGEPLVREGVEEYIAHLKALGVVDLSITTNGHLLAERCDRLIAAGLQRINISLDSLDPVRFERITRTRSYDKVMEALRRCRSRGSRRRK